MVEVKYLLLLLGLISFLLNVAIYYQALRIRFSGFQQKVFRCRLLGKQKRVSSIQTKIDHKPNTCIPENQQKIIWTYWHSGANSMAEFEKHNLQNWIDLLNKKQLVGEMPWTLIVVDDVEDSPNNIHTITKAKDKLKVNALIGFDAKTRNAITKSFILNESKTVTIPNRADLEKKLLSGELLKDYILHSDLARLGLLYKHGGTWMDSSILLVKHIDEICWRTLERVKSLMLFGYVYDVQGTHQFKQKDGLETWFISVKKNSQLIYDWLENLKKILMTKLPGQSIAEHAIFKDRPGFLDNFSLFKDYLLTNCALKLSLAEHPNYMDQIMARNANYGGPLSPVFFLFKTCCRRK